VEKEKKPNAKVSTKKAKARAIDISESEADDSDEFRVSDEDSEDEDAADVSVSEDGGEDGEEDGDYDELDSIGKPRTPSRKRKRVQTSTPRKTKRSKTVVQPTPHSKAALARRQRATSSPRKRKTFAIRLPEQSLTFQASMAHVPKDPWLRSMHALHVGSRPDSLPCREAEYERVLRCVGELLEEGSGGCICKISIQIFNFNCILITLTCRYFRRSRNW
jgi:origin recognition complex subunit 1